VSTALDPVQAHLAELDRMLRGPGSVKRSMIAEIRDGLHDATAAHRENGLDPQRAAAVAVQDFGEVREIAPLLQEELTARQGRRTALLLVVAFPALLLAWDGVWKAGSGWTGPVLPVVSALARTVDVLTVLVAAAAVVLLLVTFRGRPLPRWVTGLTGVVGALGVAGCGGLSVTMNLVDAPQSGEMLSRHPLAAAVVVFTVVTAGVVTWSAVRSLRVAWTARHSDQGADPQVG